MKQTIIKTKISTTVGVAIAVLAISTLLAAAVTFTYSRCTSNPTVRSSNYCIGGGFSNAMFCGGDYNDIPDSEQMAVLVSECTKRKCEYRCMDGYYKSDNSCVQESPTRDGNLLNNSNLPESSGMSVCTGHVPLNASVCSGSTVSVPAGTQISLVDQCTSGGKCEYTCSKEKGYVKIGNVCVCEDSTKCSNIVQTCFRCGAHYPDYKCSGKMFANADYCHCDMYNIPPEEEQRALVGECTARKCEFVCNAGFTKVGDRCVALGLLPREYVEGSMNEDSVLAILALQPLAGGAQVRTTADQAIEQASENWGEVERYISCIGRPPVKAALCPGDDKNLGGPTIRTLVSSCGSGKCEYICDSEHVFYETAMGDYCLEKSKWGVGTDSN